MPNTNTCVRTCPFRTHRYEELSYSHSDSRRYRRPATRKHRYRASYCLVLINSLSLAFTQRSSVSARSLLASVSPFKFEGNI